MTEPLEFGKAYFAALKTGKKVAISEDVYDYFLEVLPPVAWGTSYQGEKWNFGFAEGADHVTLFKKQGDGFFAVQTPFLNPYEGRGDFARQKQRWQQQWLEIGKRIPSLRQANDPPFNTQSFQECQSDAELLQKLAQGHWPAGHAFYVGNLCFINLKSGGDDWLTIKGDVTLGIIAFGQIIQRVGADEAQILLDGIRAAHVQQHQSHEQRGRE